MEKRNDLAPPERKEPKNGDGFIILGKRGEAAKWVRCPHCRQAVENTHRAKKDHAAKCRYWPGDEADGKR